MTGKSLGRPFGWLWAAYSARLEASLDADPSAAVRLREARALIDWTRQTCAANRARIADEVASLRICLRYSDPVAPPQRILRIRA